MVEHDKYLAVGVPALSLEDVPGMLYTDSG